MTKADLSKSIFKDTPGVYESQVEKVVAAVFNGIKTALKRGEAVQIHGFGIFKVSPRKERKARNLHTGGEVMVPARKAVVFTVGETLKKEVNE